MNQPVYLIFTPSSSTLSMRLRLGSPQTSETTGRWWSAGSFFGMRSTWRCDSSQWWRCRRWAGHMCNVRWSSGRGVWAIWIVKWDRVLFAQTYFHQKTTILRNWTCKPQWKKDTLFSMSVLVCLPHVNEWILNFLNIRAKHSNGSFLLCAFGCSCTLWRGKCSKGGVKTSASMMAPIKYWTLEVWRSRLGSYRKYGRRLFFSTSRSKRMCVGTWSCFWRIMKNGLLCIKKDLQVEDYLRRTSQLTTPSLPCITPHQGFWVSCHFYRWCLVGYKNIAEMVKHVILDGSPPCPWTEIQRVFDQKMGDKWKTSCESIW